MNISIRASRYSSRRSVTGLVGFLGLTLAMNLSCSGQDRGSHTTQSAAAGGAAASSTSEKLELATLGSGCFWCTEAVFLRVKGVQQVVSGYAGGSAPNPTYKEVCTGRTGHAEVVQVTFDPEIISYAELLEIFWKTHNPTTLNRQGPDKGTQYRSAIFYHNDQQKEVALAYKTQLDESKVFKRPIVTEITPFTNFYPAENYHQNFFELNGLNPYCVRYISPKIEEFRKKFSDKLKDRE